MLSAHTGKYVSKNLEISQIGESQIESPNTCQKDDTKKEKNGMQSTMPLINDIAIRARGIEIENVENRIR